MAGLKQQVAAGHSKPTPDGLSAGEKLDRIRVRVLHLQARHAELATAISRELAQAGIRILPPGGPTRTPGGAAPALHG